MESGLFVSRILCVVLSFPHFKKITDGFTDEIALYFPHKTNIYLKIFLRFLLLNYILNKENIK
ncbi:TPA: hypothetical protein ACMVDF_000146 [Clostridioides difficile]